ncbi:Golgi-associated kinase 1A [Eucyclogobius newberryi]|uniref:Golgi-associated kinase 1A n=1 Tax=Eucyclogobius newberryi TaxID=166745 RepID=UPI003B5BCD6F
MAWRVWSKLLSGHKWVLLLSPLFLLFLTIFIMGVTLPPPAPHPDASRWPSRALSSAHEFKSRARTLEQPPGSVLHRPIPFKALPSNSNNRTWERNHGKNSKNVGNDKNILKSRAGKNREKNKKETGGSARQRTSHANPQIPQFTGNSKRAKPRIKPGNHSGESYIQVGRAKAGAGHVLSVQDGDVKTILKKAGRAKQAKQKATLKDVTKSDRNFKKHNTISKEVLSAVHSKTMEKMGSIKCPSFNAETIPGGDDGSIRVSGDRREVPWFSEDDVQKMKLLAGGEPLTKARVPGHGQVLQVALEMPGQKKTLGKIPEVPCTKAHTDHCHRGQCSLIKRTDDWFEVFAFHLDRVLGLNRSLPSVLRSFHSEILPYRYIRAGPRPVVWWDPDIQHLKDSNNDQNSVPLSYVQYQKMLKARCGIKTGLNEEACVGVNHSEWSRLALFDFLLQVNDRLDRYCCGFKPDLSDLCVENRLQSKCGNTRDLQLVHILVRKADPSRLVFIDNAGRPLQPVDNLNFRLVHGIDQFPERAVSVLQSGCLESLLLRSLYADREFWGSRGGAGGLRALIRAVEQRGKILLQHIRDKQLALYTDL